MYKFFNKFSRDYLKQKGQGMVEYALILAFVVGIAAFLVGNSDIGNAIQQTFQNVTNTLNTSNANSTTSGTTTGGTSGTTTGGTTNP